MNSYVMWHQVFWLALPLITLFHESRKMFHHFCHVFSLVGRMFQPTHTNTQTSGKIFTFFSVVVRLLN